jgi:signal transduction histidine kinase
MQGMMQLDNESVNDLDQMEKEFRDFKRKVLIGNRIFLLISAVYILGVMIYYELQLRAVVGSIYIHNPETSKSMIYSLFQSKLSGQTLGASKEAMIYSGYTEHGFKYLFLGSGQIYIIVGILIFFASMVIISLITSYKINKTDIFVKYRKLAVNYNDMAYELRTSVAYANKLNRQLQDFVENIAHQIKTPLSSISLSLDILKEQIHMDLTNDFSEKCGQTIEECFFHVKRISVFIQRLLQISRMESGKVIFAHEDICLYDMLVQAVTAATTNGCKVDIVCNDCDYAIRGDGQWLGEAFINLLNNAVDYVKDSKNDNITITADCRKEKCVITVDDSGKGFNEEDLGGLFDRFETKRDAEAFHVGIGLNLAKLIIEAHHGTIQASNNENGGARFRIVIPNYNLKNGKVDL